MCYNFIIRFLKKWLLLSNILKKTGKNLSIFMTSRYEQFNFSRLLKETPSENYYSQLNYNLSNISTYLEYTMVDESKKNLEIIEMQLYKNMMELPEQLVDFYVNFEVQIFQKNETKITKQKFIEYFPSDIYSKIYQLINKINMISFDKNSTDTDLNFILKNQLNSFSISYSSAMKKIKNIEEQQISRYDNELLFSLALQVVVSFLMLILSLASYFTTGLTLSNIYNVLLSRRIHDFKPRIRTLEKFKLLLKCLKKEFYCANILQSKIMQSEDDKRYQAKIKQKKQKLKSSGCFTYNLFVSAIFSFIFFDIFIFYSIISASLFKWKISQSQHVSRYQQSIYDIFHHQLQSQAAIQQYLLYNDKFMIENLEAEKGFEIINEQFQKIQGVALKLEESESFFQLIHFQTQNYVQTILKSNLCSTVPNLREREDICEFLDNKIAKKGLLQMILRNISFLRELYARTLQITGLKAQELYQDQVYKEWEYTLEVLYQKVYRGVQKQLLSFNIKIFDEEANTLKLNIFISGCFLLFFGVLLLVVAVKNLEAQFESGMFNFHLIPISLIIDNSIVKKEFLRLLRLNKNYF